MKYMALLLLFITFLSCRNGQDQLEYEISFNSLRTKIDSGNFEDFVLIYEEIEIDTLKGESGQSLLQYSLSMNKGNFASFIIEKEKCDLNYEDEDGMTALHYAVILPSAKLVRQILESNKVSLKKESYNDILSQSFLKRHTPIETLVLLFEYGVEVKKEEYGPIYSSVIFGQCNKLQLLLENHVELNENYGEEGNLLNVASKYDCRCILQNENGIKDKIELIYNK